MHDIHGGALATARYISLTTFRADGSAVATPVWFAPDPDGPRLYVTSDVDAYKVRRLRRDPRVTVAPCDIAGRLDPDAEPVPGRGRVLAPEDTARVRRRIRRRYGREYWLTGLRLTLTRQRRPSVGIEIVLAPHHPGAGTGR
ncbi:PPOX class F420-dependent oxidoreductase [Marinitenerispora sediminis]|uniref:PPOX class F420-dependent oxidoreductase n=1 Tax=Marinitenerispora sediminis TaxID=1931232 RepID=A0A368TAB6_9ACTN|nr:PPOX class F420-dependent oxidoreductase [Marinitenerispora sediminis]RCV53973.1 PPOX class F420-dependent oxidoreductase [Marinitenerispora sediminis]RCV60476.1 PPOX class F420-dependent oxidoreductase [Marinitenerispora sediminis]RCV61843.1 PPOX class F420-dependent oxidoreductase [Marinitenerispora sediminis]